MKTKKNLKELFVSLLRTIKPKAHKKTATETHIRQFIECPYHPGEFYRPEMYCEKCYIEEKNKL